MEGWQVNDEVERILEESGRGLIFRYYPDIHLEWLRKTTKTSVGIAGLLTEIWTRDVRSTKQDF
jgi:hypothetical protein